MVGGRVVDCSGLAQGHRDAGDVHDPGVRVGHLPATLLADERLEDGADLRVVQEGGLAGLGRTGRENKEGGL